MPSRSVWDLAPELREIAAEWVGRCEAAGVTVLITCTYRSNEEQQEAWSRGRDATGKVIAPRKIITWARPGQSKHNVLDAAGRPAARALDFVPMRGGKCVWGLDDQEDKALWDKALEIARQLGLRCGADWPKRKRDYPHLELMEVT